MFARLDEIPAKTLQDIKKTKRYGWTNGRTDGELTRGLMSLNCIPDLLTSWFQSLFYGSK